MRVFLPGGHYPGMQPGILAPPEIFAEISDAFAGGRLADAAVLLDRALATVPDGWQAYSLRNGIVYACFWDEYEAGAYLATHPERRFGENLFWQLGSYSMAAFCRSNLAFHEGDLAAAAGYLERGLQLEPDHPHLLARTAFVRTRERDYRQALDLLDRAARGRSWATPRQQVLALREAACLMADLGMLGPAERAIRDALALDPNDALARMEYEFILAGAEHANRKRARRAPAWVHQHRAASVALA